MVLRAPHAGSGTGCEDFFIKHWTPVPSPIILWAVTESLTIQGRCLSPAELHGLRQWVGENPRWSRWATTGSTRTLRVPAEHARIPRIR